jgi:hypothetical protein
MIKAEFEFDGTIDKILEILVGLPPKLRPIYFTSGEKARSKSDRVDDTKRFNAFRARNTAGFGLVGPFVSYNFRRSTGLNGVCSCFIDVEPESAQQLMILMSKARPLFGFACKPEEYDQRNRVKTRLGQNSIEAWVGRDIRKYIPGLYWLTLVPEPLLKQHHVPLSALTATAAEHLKLENGQHLLRFYPRPEDWETVGKVAELCSNVPGIFDVEEIKPWLLTVNNYTELDSLLVDWK